jgi:hypothetical protein
MYSTWNPNDYFYENIARFSYLINVFMSLCYLVTCYVHFKTCSPLSPNRSTSYIGLGIFVISM